MAPNDPAALILIKAERPIRAARILFCRSRRAGALSLPVSA
jgi:hypothetical protein